MRGRGLSAAAVVAFLCVFLCAPAWASTWTGPDGSPVNIEYWAGSGSNEALLVIEFAEETGTPEYAFGFRFDGSATGWDMIHAVDQAGSLEVQASSYGSMGYFINNFTYDGHTGNSSTWWHYWVAESDSDYSFPSGGWTSSGVGCSGRTLSDGSWDGWANPFSLDRGPEIPTVPIPGAVWLLVSGLLVISGLRKKSL